MALSETIARIAKATQAYYQAWETKLARITRNFLESIPLPHSADHLPALGAAMEAGVLPVASNALRHDVHRLANPSEGCRKPFGTLLCRHATADATWEWPGVPRRLGEDDAAGPNPPRGDKRRLLRRLQRLRDP